MEVKLENNDPLKEALEKGQVLPSAILEHYCQTIAALTGKPSEQIWSEVIEIRNRHWESFLSLLQDRAKKE